MNNDELRIKFDSLATPVIGADGARRLADAVAAIESSNVASLMGLTMR